MGCIIDQNTIIVMTVLLAIALYALYQLIRNIVNRIFPGTTILAFNKIRNVFRVPLVIISFIIVIAAIIILIKKIVGISASQAITIQVLADNLLLDKILFMSLITFLIMNSILNSIPREKITDAGILTEKGAFGWKDVAGFSVKDDGVEFSFNQSFFFLKSKLQHFIKMDAEEIKTFNKFVNDKKHFKHNKHR